MQFILLGLQVSMEFFQLCLSNSIPSQILFCPLLGNLTKGLFGILCENKRKCSKLCLIYVMIMVWAAVVLASSSYQCFVVSIFLMLTMEDSGSFFQYLLVFFFFHLYSDFLLPEYNITFVLEQIIPLFYSLILHGF